MQLKKIIFLKSPNAKRIVSRKSHAEIFKVFINRFKLFTMSLYNGWPHVKKINFKTSKSYYLDPIHFALSWFLKTYFYQYEK